MARQECHSPDGAELCVETSLDLRCRLRSSGWGAFDTILEPNTDGQWRRAEVAIGGRGSYRLALKPLTEVCFRPGTEGEPWELELGLDDIALFEEPSLPASYQPHRLARDAA